MPSPIGTLLVGACPEGVTSIQFEGQWWPSMVPHTRDASPARPMLERTCAELVSYFSGSRRPFLVPCVLPGTDFQRSVWNALRGLAFGQVASYAAIARQIGHPTSVRAVGAANGRNPVPIIVPCHRVIGSDGSLTGFGGGLPLKRWLLEHEGVMSRQLL